MNTMIYKGYTALVGFDEDDEIFTGRIQGINDVIGFHAETVPGLKQAFHEAVDDYIATCERLGKKPERAFSGRVMFRVAPEVHAGAALAAERSGKSLNPWAEEALAAAIGKSAPAEPKKKMTRVVGTEKRSKPQRGLKSSVPRERVGRR
jgi:predicted HicB family RNase H-like nuclease